jgi:acetyl-CoA synthetase
MQVYNKLYARSLSDNDGFWRDQAYSLLNWFAPFTQVTQGDFKHGDVAWFLNGKINVSYNCVDRHVAKHGDKIAILFEGDEPGDVRRITYRELLREVCKFANALKTRGVKKGDRVCIYMPMVPEAAIAMLACARVGAAHSVVFAGFSAESLRDRILDCQCGVVITADEGKRGGKAIPLKSIADEALLQCPNVHTAFVYRHSGARVNFSAERDVWWQEAVAKERPYCPPEWMDSEDPLFMLYTSGSTGKPKGILHTTGGYLVYAAITHKYVFDLKPDDVYACVADVGWVTGHSYIVYGPLANCATTLMFESTPLYPDAGRYWDMVQRHKINIFYTAPTALRALMKYEDGPVKKYDRSSLRVLGSVGEPINPEAWRWYFDVVGDGRCAIVDTFWQTETGGIVMTPLPGCTPMKPGAAMRPFFGVEPVLMNDQGKVLEGNDVSGMLCFARPWPGIARGVYGDHPRYLTTYMSAFPGLYFTGDGAIRDKDGDWWITGRVDDVINVSGHRLGSAEIESALVEHPSVVEAAVVGVPHDIKGWSLFAYVLCKEGVVSSPTLLKELANEVRKHVGAFAQPDDIIVAPGLPKTRSGKIMRRLLRKIACQETDSLGDITTLADPSIVTSLIKIVNEAAASKKN